ARDYATAIPAAQRLLADDPWRDDVLRTLVRLRYEAGDRAGALAEYEGFAAALRDELGTEPMAETQAAYASVLSDVAPQDDDAAAAAAHASADASAHDGIAGRTIKALPFAGRAAELAALRERFDAMVAGG